MHYKDTILDRLARTANVAQFVSFNEDLEQRYSRVFGMKPNHKFESVYAAARALLERSAEKLANIRSFHPANPKSREFVYGIRSPEEVVAHVRRLADSGLYTIINETIDVNDGGVSGVAAGDLIEFAPKDTPRAVEKPGVASMPRRLGMRLLRTVYGFIPQLNYPRTTRVEFSIHPIRRGVRAEHTIVWELEQVSVLPPIAELHWPNRFSEFIGDKVFGLLIAHLLGLFVPRTLVIARSVAPFSFGRDTGVSEVWLRTSPRVQVPGKFTTHRGWSDPFALLSNEDPDGTYLASVVAQQEVSAQYSGAILAADNGDVTLEGTRGFGDEFMIGKASSIQLPRKVRSAVLDVYHLASKRLGPVRMEWVFDGRDVWVVQFHRGASVSSGSVIYPGDTTQALRFDITRGLEELRDLIGRPDSRAGIVLVGDVGITSHFGDVLRKAKVPSRIERLTALRVNGR